MTDIEQLAQARSEDTNTPFLEWLNTFNETAQLRERIHLPHIDLKLLANNCEQPRQLTLILEALDEYQREHPDVKSTVTLLIDYANDSPYDIAQWLSAVEYFYQWLEQNSRIAGLTPILEYISCCTQSTQAFGGKMPLKDILSDMLDQYGFQQG